MLQESATFDLRSMIDGPSIKTEVYTFFFLIAFIVTAAKVVRIWWVAPPFRLSRQATTNPRFPVILENSIHSLKHWSDFTLLAWGLLTSLTVTDLCNQLPYHKSAGFIVILSVFRELSVALTMAMLVMLLSLFARWHMLKRIEYLRGQALQTVPETDKPSH